MTLLAITCGFISLVVFSGYIAGTYLLIEDEIKHRMMYGDIIIEDYRLEEAEGRSQYWKYLIDLSEQKSIESKFKNHPQFSVLSKFLPFSGVIRNAQSESMVVGLGVDVEASEKLRAPKWSWNVISGIPLHEQKNDDALILGEGLAEFMSCLPKEKKKEKIAGASYQKNTNYFSCEKGTNLQINAITIDSQLNAMDADVVGITNAGFKEVDNRLVIAPIGFVQSLIDTNRVGYYSLLLKNNVDALKWVESINKELKESNSSLKAYHWKDHPLAGDLYKKSREMLNIFNFFIIGVILVIVGLSVFNSFVKTVFERRKEIGTMKSIGFSNLQIARLFLSESFLITILGCMIGTIFTIVIKIVLDQLDIPYSAGLFQELVLFKILLVKMDLLYACLLMIVLSSIATYLSLGLAFKRKIVENLNASL